MDIIVKTNAKEVSDSLRSMFQDQIPFATSQALNRTALDFQKVQRSHQRMIFVVRRPTWVDRAVKITQFSKKALLEAIIAVAPPGERADILAKFEEDTKKTPLSGRSVAVPTRYVPKTPAGIIRKGWRPSDLLGGAKTGSSHKALPGGGMLLGNEVTRGQKRTFLIRKPDGSGTLFMRIEEEAAARKKKAGADGVRRHLKDKELVPLYQFVPSVGIEPELNFEENAQDTVQRRFEENFAAAFNAAVEGAR